ncbi:MAG TPA: thioredoxin domain-containing protein, partial [Dehalococcoidia bacterium]
VMERECFENPEIAALMNREFVNVKVDREERPDLDAVYMTAVQAMTGHGGWPMSVFLTPDGRPFYAGTYFPPEDRGPMPGFPRVLQAVAEAYRTRKAEVLAATERVVEAIRAGSATRPSPEPLTHDLLDAAYAALAERFDWRDGGLAGAPKFPQPQTYDFLLRYWHGTGTEQALRLVDLTLERMARGGIYDQVGGGFHRYATDARWLVPHFEKMLYDNALLASLYLHGWLVTGRPRFRRVVEETLSYVLREMTGPDGGFYSATDADSEGEEGRFFVWTPAEIDAAVGPETGRVVRAYYGVTEEGNFEGRNILHVPRDEGDVAAELGLPVEELLAMVEEARPRLLAARDRRVRPGLDDKVLTAWNGLMLRALAECGAALERPEWLEAARRNADFLLRELVRDGRLLRTWKDGRASAIKGYLEDHAFLAEGLITLYEATFERRWLDEAARLADTMIDLFWSGSEEIFYDTGRDQERLLVRPRDIFDNATPCGSSAAAMALLRLARLTGEERYVPYAEQSLRSVRDFLAQIPSGFAYWLAALDFYLSPPKELVLVGPPEDPAMTAMRRVAYGRYAPNRVTAGAPGPVTERPLPLLAGRGLEGGRPTAYVCENYACLLPVTSADALREQLDAAKA